MPIYNAPLTCVNKEETRRYAGLRGDATFPEALLDKACTEALILAKPQGCWHLYPYDAANGTILGHPHHRLTGNSILRHLAQAVEIAVLGVTIGPALEEEVSNQFSVGEYTAGLLLDSAGTTAVEATADAVNAIISTQASRRGLTAISRFSPGYGDWKITDQPDILGLLSEYQIGLSVTPSCMLTPRKSVTAVIGLLPTGSHQPKEICAIAGCQSCSQQNCLARKG